MKKKMMLLLQHQFYMQHAGQPHKLLMHQFLPLKPLILLLRKDFPVSHITFQKLMTKFLKRAFDYSDSSTVMRIHTKKEKKLAAVGSNTFERMFAKPN